MKKLFNSTISVICSLVGVSAYHERIWTTYASIPEW